MKRDSGLDSLLNRPEQESGWKRFLKSPAASIATHLYNHFAQRPRNDYHISPIRLICISDTHNTQPELPDGDILIHAGDLTQSVTRAELEAQIDWLDASKPGHDTANLDWKSLTYLQNSSTEIVFGSRRVRAFGFPYTPRHGNWAFQYPRSEDFWDELEMPDADEGVGDVRVLITHGPPRAHLDLGRGCASLRARLWRMPARQRPAVHVFRHIHGAYGGERVKWNGFQRAYEGVMDGRAKWMNLLLVGWYAMVRMLGWGGEREGERGRVWPGDGDGECGCYWRRAGREETRGDLC